MFVDDIKLPNCNFGILIRSPSASGILKDIECPHINSRYTLIRAKDIPGENKLLGSEMPILADNELLYIGQPCAILVGPDRLKLENYAADCKVIVEERTPVFFNQQYQPYESNEPEIFEQKTIEFDNTIKKDEDESANFVVECSYTTGIQEHWYSEAHGAAVSFQDGTITIHTASQWHDHVKESAAKVLGIPEYNITVEDAELGTHLDGKIWFPSLVACQTALAAFIAKKNVKIMFSRIDDFYYSPKRPKTETHYKSVLDSTGTVLETDIDIKFDMGAFGIFTDTILDDLCRSAYALYKLGKVRINAAAIKTNIPPAGPFDGFGASYGIFALERHISKIADTLHEDGALWRLEHLQNKKSIHSFPEELIECVIGECDYRRKWGSYELLRRREKKAGEKITPLRGIGISLGCSSTERVFTLNERSEIALQNQQEKEPVSACAVVEVEIDPVEYSANIRGIWIAVKTEYITDKIEMRYKIIRSLNTALGWASAEKINYIDGQLFYGITGEYDVPIVIQKLPIQIEFIESSETVSGTIEEVPYGIFSAAYLQAVSQALNHAFNSIPISAFDIWQIMNTRELEMLGEKEA
ncbi:hypothetical protein AGMMS50212_07740 [Spirochaetia bacterium]|nr:hypothetical protein AGMMS50212_07740 [Spirochaetia bacterium]